MGPKKVGAKKKRMMCLDIKHEIIEKHEQGVRVVDLARQYDRSASMICSVLKQKESIKAITPAKGVTIISKRRTALHEEMEKLLLAWMTESQLAGDSVTESIICEKARAIYRDLMRQTPGTSTDEAPKESFKASRGWLDNFKKRIGIHSVVRHGHGQHFQKHPDFGEKERVKMDPEEPRSSIQSKVLESTGKHGLGFNSNVDHNERNESPEVMYSGATGMSLSRVLLPPVQQDECTAQLWESQKFLRTMECSHSQWTSPPLSKETTPLEDTRDFLASFERVAEACHWPKEEWTTRLLPALNGEAKEAFLNLDDENREDYEKVKAALLRGDAIIREKDRQRFRGFRCLEAEGLKEGYRQLQELCRRWLKVERRSKEEMLEMVVLEQFLALLPTEVHDWVMGHYPETGSQAVDLAEDFLLRQRKAEREEEQVPQEVLEAARCSESDQLVSDEQGQLPISIKKEKEDELTSMFDSAPSASPLNPTKKEWGTPDDNEKCMPKISSVVGSYESSAWKVEENVTASFKEKNSSLVLGTENGVDWLKQEWEPCIILSAKTDVEATKESVNASRMVEGEHAKERREGCFPGLLENPVEKEHKADAVEKLYVCFVCRKGFNRIESLASHQRIHQEGKRCSYSEYEKGSCDQSTKHQGRHTEKKPYQCAVCKKSYQQKVRLIMHHRIHTKETPGKHLESGKSFVPNTSLASNQKIYTGEKPYQCPFCRKSFGYKASLLSHQIIHTREKPHKCSDCSKSYLIQSSLMKHKRIHRG
nr:zinc finger and SCAN domain-containing protein 12-like isoform X2 [Anolis sagrei ordinatus]